MVTTASGPDPSGCARCGSVTCPVPATRAAFLAAYSDPDRKADVIGAERAVAEAGRDCLTRPEVNWQAALAAALESISDALAGPDAVRNCDFRSPTVAEVTENAKRLRNRFETARG